MVHFLENRINEANFYAEDNWKVRENLTLNIGLRYEYVSAPKEAAGRINYGFSDDKDNWEPRVGFAWSSKFKGGLRGRLFGQEDDAVVRGAYGIYHGRIFQSVFSREALRSDSIRRTRSFTTNRVWPQRFLTLSTSRIQPEVLFLCQAPKQLAIQLQSWIRVWRCLTHSNGI